MYVILLVVLNYANKLYWIKKQFITIIFLLQRKLRCQS